MTNTITLYYNKEECWVHTLFCKVEDNGKSTVSNHLIQTVDSEEFSIENTRRFYIASYGEANVRVYFATAKI